MLEKPFGKDVASAQELNRVLLNAFKETDVYRIDHYLGKKPIHNMLVFRFANAFMEACVSGEDDRLAAGGGCSETGYKTSSVLLQALSEASW